MPVIIVDSEQADLIRIAAETLEGALTARVQRADPEAIISNSLALQAAKLKTVRVQLQAPDPPKYSRLEKSMRLKAEAIIKRLADPQPREDRDALWEALRMLAIAPGFPET